MTQPVIVVGLLCVLCGCQSLQDLSDQKALIKQCHIPPYAELVDYQGSSLGATEGKSYTARFRIPRSDLGKCEKFMREDGWAPLPASAGLRARLLNQGQGLESYFNVAEGLFRCQAAGDRVLHAEKTSPCAEAKLFEIRTPIWDDKGNLTYRQYHALIDVILTVFDKTTGVLTAHVASAY